MNEIIKRRLAELERLIAPRGLEVVIENKDGTRERKRAVEWWEHRREWTLADFDYQDNRGGLVVCLVFASLADEALDKAKAEGNTDEIRRMEQERDEMLKMYFGGDIS